MRIKLPSAWTQYKIGDIAEVKGGKRLPKGEKFAEGITEYPYIRVTDFKSGLVDDSELRYLTPQIQNQISRYTIDKEDLYISIAGTIGLVGKIPPYLDGANLTENAAKITDIKKIEQDFLIYYLNSFYGQKQIEELTGKTSQPKLALTRIKKIEVPVPPLVEQCGIAEVLGTVDEAIRLTNQVIERTETLKGGLMQRLLTQGIGHTEFKDTTLGKIPKTWELARVGRYIKLLKSGISRQFTGDDIGYPVIRSSNIQNGKLILNNIKYWYKVDTQGADLRNLILDDNDILVNFINSIDQMGKSCLFKKQIRDFIYTTNIFRIKLDENKILHRFFLYFTQSWIYKKQFLQMTKAAVQQASITQKDFSDIKIPVPSINEQYKILSILDSCEEQLNDYASNKNIIVLLKQGLMQVLLSGEKRVELREDGLHRIGNS